MQRSFDHVKKVADSANVATSSVSSRRWGMLICGLLFLFLVNLGTRGLNDPDEGRYANIAHEMQEPEHGWWEPQMSDFAHFDKPPLIYWTTAVAFKIFGENEWAARLPCVLGALLALAGVGWTAFRLHGERVAWWTVLFCGTFGQFWLLGRFLTPDMLLTGLCTVAIACWAEARHRDGSIYWWFGCAFFWALAWWTKATPALVPLLGLSIGLWITGDRRGLRALRPLRLLLLVLVIGAPWYVSMMQRHPDLRAFFFGREMVGRITGHPDGRHGPIYYHIAVTLIGWLPWWPMALGVLFFRRRDWMNHFQKEKWRAVPMEAWMVMTGLVIFSLISSKLPTYTLPFAPWAALLSARMLLRKTEAEQHVIGTPVLLRLASCFAVLFVAISFVMPRVESRLGLNSSLREVASYLRKEHAQRIYMDRYMSGIEFYFGENVFYVTEKVPRELPSDQGICEEIGESHFIRPASLPEHLQQHAGGDTWFIRYNGKSSSPLATALASGPGRESVRIGNFVLDRFTIGGLHDPDKHASQVVH